MHLPSGENGLLDMTLRSRTWDILVTEKITLSRHRIENDPEKALFVEAGRVVNNWSPNEIVHTNDFDLAIQNAHKRKRVPAK